MSIDREARNVARLVNDGDPHAIQALVQALSPERQLELARRCLEAAGELKVVGASRPQASSRSALQ